MAKDGHTPYFDDTPWELLSSFPLPARDLSEFPYVQLQTGAGSSARFSVPDGLERLRRDRRGSAGAFHAGTKKAAIPCSTWSRFRAMAYPAEFPPPSHAPFGRDRRVGLSCSHAASRKEERRSPNRHKPAISWNLAESEFGAPGAVSERGLAGVDSQVFAYLDLHVGRAKLRLNRRAAVAAHSGAWRVEDGQEHFLAALVFGRATITIGVPPSHSTQTCVAALPLGARNVRRFVACQQADLRLRQRKGVFVQHAKRKLGR